MQEHHQHYPEYVGDLHWAPGLQIPCKSPAPRLHACTGFNHNALTGNVRNELIPYRTPLWANDMTNRYQRGRLSQLVLPYFILVVRFIMGSWYNGVVV